MDKEQEQLQEQDAPLKNTDHAYVKVSEDGSPEMPDKGEEKDKNTEASRVTDLDKR
jgi:hypothetical protein